MKLMRKAARYTWTDYKTNKKTARELNITPVLDKILEYKRNWLQYINRMPCNRSPIKLNNYRPTGKRNQGTPSKRLLDVRPERVNKWPISTLAR
jgi:hypothetical protein